MSISWQAQLPPWQLPLQQSLSALQLAPPSAQQLPKTQGTPPQQSWSERQVPSGVPGGMQPQVPLAQMPLQQSAAVEQQVGVSAQQPFFCSAPLHASPRQHSPELSQEPSPGPVQLAPVKATQPPLELPELEALVEGPEDEPPPEVEPEVVAPELELEPELEALVVLDRVVPVDPALVEPEPLELELADALELPPVPSDTACPQLQPARQSVSRIHLMGLPRKE